jgi:acetate---CoA ligase (ADP-forming)
VQSVSHLVLGHLFSPDRVAVIGAADRDGNRGATACRLLGRLGFAGDVYPIHPAGEAVAGYPAYTSLASVPARPDVAIIAVGAARVTDAVRDLARYGIDAAIVWAGGFAETGSEGAARQVELQEVAARSGVRVLGPNCLGVVNSSTGFTGTFASWLTRATRLIEGSASMVSQSGGLAASAQSWLQEFGLGLRLSVSTGNETGIRAVDVLNYLVDDEGTRVICAYLEGVDDGLAVIEALRRAGEAGKPVVILKGGKSPASARAVTAHTGVLAGEGRIWQAMLSNEGAIEVRSLEELVDVVSILDASIAKPRPTGDRVVIVSYGGGQGVLAADQAHDAGLTVPELTAGLRAQLAPLVPAIASTRNPVDLTPEAFNRPEWRERLPDAIEVLDASDECDAILLQLGAMNRGADEVAMTVIQAARKSAKPVVLQCRSIPDSAVALLAAHRVRAFADQPAAIVAIRLLTEWSMRPSSTGLRPVPAAARRLPLSAFETSSALSPEVITEHEVYRLLARAGIPTPGGQIVSSADEAVAYAASRAGPVVMKIESTAVTHRAAAGLLRLRLADEAAVRTAYRELCERADAFVPAGYRIFIMPMWPAGFELLVSGFDDPTFGRLICVGAGGGLAELLDDVAFAQCPLTPGQAWDLLRRLRIAGYSSIFDVRGEGTAAADLVSAISDLVAEAPWKGFVLELNPVVVRPGSAVPVDGLLLLGGAARQA